MKKNKTTSKEITIKTTPMAPTIKKMRKEFPAQLASEMRKVEDVGTTVLQTSQQIMLAMEKILEEDFSFTDDDLWKMRRKLTHMILTLAEIPDKGIFVLGARDMINVKKMAEMNMERISSEERKQLEPPKKKVDIPKELLPK